MDVIFGFVGDKFAVVVSDTTAVQQIIINKDDEDKTLELDSHKLMAMSGPKGDCVYFGEYIQANMKLYELRNGLKLSTHAASSYTRNQLAIPAQGTVPGEHTYSRATTPTPTRPACTSWITSRAARR